VTDTKTETMTSVTDTKSQSRRTKVPIWDDGKGANWNGIGKSPFLIGDKSSNDLLFPLSYSSLFMYSFEKWMVGRHLFPYMLLVNH